MKDNIKWALSKVLYFALTFILGVIIASVFHIIIANHRVRTMTEAVCTVFGADEQECKDNIDNVLDIADNEMQNSMGGEK